jgi:hypothetical protein
VGFERFCGLNIGMTLLKAYRVKAEGLDPADGARAFSQLL